MKYYIVDAFTDELFKGNPAGVCILENELEILTMQKIAAENNLSETAFALKQEGYYNLRWFTPKKEINLCGHATLGTAFIIANFVDKNAVEFRFETKSGTLTVDKKDDLYIMDFPANKPQKTKITQQMEKAISASVCEAYISRDLMLLLENEQQIRNLIIDFNLIKEIADHAVIVTAKGDSVDFVSRVFAPNMGIDEDPVTGSTHTTLIPFWSERLNKNKMTAMQLSERGGMIHCEDCGNRVKMAGKAVLYLQGELFL